MGNLGGDAFLCSENYGAHCYAESAICLVDCVESTVRKKIEFSEVDKMEKEDGVDGLEKAEPTVFSGFVGIVA